MILSILFEYNINFDIIESLFQMFNLFENLERHTFFVSRLRYVDAYECKDLILSFKSFDELFEFLYFQLFKVNFETSISRLRVQNNIMFDQYKYIKYNIEFCKLNDIKQSRTLSKLFS